MYRLKLDRVADKFIHRANPGLKKKIDVALLDIQKNPLSGEPLHGKLRGLRSYHFFYKKVEYRVIYDLIKTEKIIGVVSIMSRETGYRRLERNR